MKLIPCLIGILTVSALAMLAQDSVPRLVRPVANWPSADQMHRGYVEQFISHPGFGYGRMAMPFEISSQFTDAGDNYRLKRVDLIGVAEHPAPVAFVSPNRIPRKSEITNKLIRPKLATRALSSFETNALAKLSAGRDLVLNLKGGEALGSIRARSDCLNCHQVKTGELLGALSYQVTPATNSLKPELPPAALLTATKVPVGPPVLPVSY